MSTVLEPHPRTLADVLRDLGDVPAFRVRAYPAHGSATLNDLLLPGNESCELVDGILVEKAVGQEESFLGMWLGMVINQFVCTHNSGYVTGEQGASELPSGSVRVPDVSFFSWDRLPDRRRPKAPIPQLTPDLAVEVLSVGNTKREMTRKRDEYFWSGTRLVWEVDPRAKTVAVYTSPENVVNLSDADTLAGDPVLPGFVLPLADLFAELDRHG